MNQTFKPAAGRTAVAVAFAATVLAGLTLPGAAHAQAKPDKKASFFVTSTGPGKGGDLGGLAGADAHCDSLAKAAGLPAHTWRAYLSTTATGGAKAVNARDRIGKGPWYN